MLIETLKTILLVDRILNFLRKHLCKDQTLITYCEKCRKNSYVRLKTRFNGRDIVTIFACPKCESHFEKAEDREIATPLEEYKELVETLKTKYKVKFEDDKPILTIKRDKKSGPGFTRDY